MESGILYNAIFENDKTLSFDMGRLDSFEHISKGTIQGYEGVMEIFSIYDVSEENIYILHDMKNERTLCAKID